MNTILTCDKQFDDYLEAKIKNDTAPYLTDSSNKVLSNTVKDVTTQANGNKPRLGLGYGPADVSGVPNRFYVRRYLRYSSELASPGTGKWFVQQEFKSTGCDLPRRLSLQWLTTTDPVGGGVLPYYRLRMDQENNCDVANGFDPVPDFPDQICYPTKGGNCPDFRALAGQWFYDEYFVKYSAGGSSTDRVAYAINGQVIFDRTGPVKTSTPRGIKLTPGYLNIPNVGAGGRPGDLSRLPVPHVPLWSAVTLLSSLRCTLDRKTPVGYPAGVFFAATRSRPSCRRC